ncbi:hypothetical protein [Mycoplasmopsis alligatoris]|uniref:Lipoprotein n=1 Tax=Mycoplasmopsis alligatoris A21JP2 TaxID=747682 RepID=D4XVC6_9BACT|nr:hypothetical protein [Mycoplasmopsis alligatoris]EFF41582.1 hypothetical protein MALL_0656 [Mycoplasmopsis alligatoris A21JP2]
MKVKLLKMLGVLATMPIAISAIACSPEATNNKENTSTDKDKKENKDNAGASTNTNTDAANANKEEKETTAKVEEDKRAQTDIDAIASKVSLKLTGDISEDIDLDYLLNNLDKAKLDGTFENNFTPLEVKNVNKAEKSLEVVFQLMSLTKKYASGLKAGSALISKEVTLKVTDVTFVKGKNSLADETEQKALDELAKKVKVTFTKPVPKTINLEYINNNLSNLKLEGNEGKSVIFKSVGQVDAAKKTVALKLTLADYSKTYKSGDKKDSPLQSKEVEYVVQGVNFTDAPATDASKPVELSPDDKKLQEEIDKVAEKIIVTIKQPVKKELTVSYLASNLDKLEIKNFDNSKYTFLIGKVENVDVSKKTATITVAIADLVKNYNSGELRGRSITSKDLVLNLTEIKFIDSTTETTPTTSNDKNEFEALKKLNEKTGFKKEGLLSIENFKWEEISKLETNKFIEVKYEGKQFKTEAGVVLTDVLTGHTVVPEKTYNHKTKAENKALLYKMSNDEVYIIYKTSPEVTLINYVHAFNLK